MDQAALEKILSQAQTTWRPVIVTLHNGSSHTGVIVKTGPTYIKLQVGYNTMTVFKAMIKEAKVGEPAASN